MDVSPVDAPVGLYRDWLAALLNYLAIPHYSVSDKRVSSGLVSDSCVVEVLDRDTLLGHSFGS